MKISYINSNNINRISYIQKITYKSSYINYDTIDINSKEWKRFCAMRKNPNLYRINPSLLRKICSDDNLSKKLEEISKKQQHSQNLLAMSEDKRLIPLIDSSKMPLSSLLHYSTFNKETCQKFSSLLNNSKFYNYLSNLEKNNDVFDYEINNLLSLNEYQFDIMTALLNKAKNIDTKALADLYQDTLAENFFMKYNADIFSLSYDEKLDESLNMAKETLLKECKKRNISDKKIEKIKQSLNAIEFLEDNEIKKYLIARFLMMTQDKKTDIDIHLNEVNMLINAINTFRSHYSTYKKTPFENSYITDFIKFLKKQNIDKSLSFEEILDQLKEKQITADVLKCDFEKEARLYLLKEYLKTYYDSPIADYLYALYLKDCYYNREIDLDDIKKLDEIKNKYNTRIILSSKTDETKDILDYIDKEFASWNKASKGKALYPHVIDFLSAKKVYYDKYSAHGMGNTMAFAEGMNLDSISYKSMTSSYVEGATRHEMTHLNDKKALNGFHYMLFPLLKKMFEKQFKKAGISKVHINYAFTHPREMIAVASEGNLSEYSPAFKKILNNYGMPEWEFNLEDEDY